MACKGGGFRPDALHQTTVATHRIDVIVKDFESRLVITAAKPAPCNRHADAHGNSLTKWSGSSLDCRDQVVLGMTWCLAAQLPESTPNLTTCEFSRICDKLHPCVGRNGIEKYIAADPSGPASCRRQWPALLNDFMNKKLFGYNKSVRNPKLLEIIV